MFEKYKIVNNVNASNIFHVIKEINKKYNNSYHSILKATPQEIMNDKEKNNELTINEVKNISNNVNDLNKGDDVRVFIKNDMDLFNKLTSLWSKEILEKKIQHAKFEMCIHKLKIFLPDHLIYKIGNFL